MHHDEKGTDIRRERTAPWLGGRREKEPLHLCICTLYRYCKEVDGWATSHPDTRHTHTSALVARRSSLFHSFLSRSVQTVTSRLIPQQQRAGSAKSKTQPSSPPPSCNSFTQPPCHIRRRQRASPIRHLCAAATCPFSLTQRQKEPGRWGISVVNASP